MLADARESSANPLNGTETRSDTKTVRGTGQLVLAQTRQTMRAADTERRGATRPEIRAMLRSARDRTLCLFVAVSTPWTTMALRTTTIPTSKTTTIPITTPTVITPPTTIPASGTSVVVAVGSNMGVICLDCYLDAIPGARFSYINVDVLLRNHAAHTSVTIPRHIVPILPDIDFQLVVAIEFR
ncbi:MAG: hypothetical protein JO100_04785 [Pseudonocardia sp.]|nr:hypothetical protein [Pseudonocardia sp.]